MWLEREHQPFLGEEHCMKRQKQLCGILTEALSCNISCNNIAKVDQPSDRHQVPIEVVSALESFLCLTLGLDNFE